MADENQPASFASAREPEASSAEIDSSQYVKPIVNWNSGNSRAIRTSLRGSRTLSTSQPTTPTSVDPRSTIPDASTNETTSVQASKPAASISMDPPPMTTQYRTLEPTTTGTMSDIQAAPTSYSTAPLTVNTQATTLEAPIAGMSSIQSSATNPVDLQLAASQPIISNSAPADETLQAVKEGRRLYIGNLHKSATKQDIEEFFKGYQVEKIDIPTKPIKTQPHAFVDPRSAMEAQDMVSKFSGQPINNQKVTVQIARPKASNPATNQDSAADHSAPINETFNVGKPEGMPWSELIARAKVGLDDAKGELKRASQQYSSGNGRKTGTHEAVPEVASREDFHEAFPVRPRTVSLQEQDQRPDLDSQDRTRLESGTVISLSSSEDENGVILNLASPQGQQLEEGELSDAASDPSTKAITHGPVKATVGTKRGFDEISNTAEGPVESSESDDDSNNGMNYDEEDGESDDEGEEDENDHDKESNDESQGDQDASEEGEIAEGSESDEDAMIAQYSNANLQPRESQGDDDLEVIDVELMPSATPSREPSPIPGVVAGGGPKTLKDLSPSQLRIQVRYFYVGRDLNTVPESDPVRCTICAKSGHVKKYCPSATCFLCGEFGDHFAHSCPQNPRCSRCRGRHDVSTCNLKLKPDNLRLTCDLCHEDGHEEGDCELRWRSSGPLWKTPLPPLSVPRYCYECGRPGHLGNDCPQRRPGKPMGSSMWSESGLPNPVQSIKNIVPGQLPPPRPRQKGPAPNKKPRKYDSPKKARTGSANDPINLDDSPEDNDNNFLGSGPRRGQHVRANRRNAAPPMRIASINDQGGNRYSNVPPPGQYNSPAHGLPGRPRPGPGNARTNGNAPFNYDERGYGRDNYRTLDGARRRSRSPPRMTRPPGNEPFSRGGQGYRPGQQEISIKGRADRMGGR